MSLREQIEQEIRARGPIPFSRYMQICLYDPVAGYYSRNAEQFGKAGDFYTSSDVHAVFARLLTRQFEKMWRTLDRPPEIEILELGPGRGLFARDVLDWSRKKFPEFFAALRYTLQESSPGLRTKLHENLRDFIAAGKVTIGEGQPESVQRTTPHDVPMIVFANEFFDALPVEILTQQGKLYLGIENTRLREMWLAPTKDEFEYLDCYGVHPEPGERIEVPRLSQSWTKSIADSMSRGFVVVIDYGYTRAQQLAGHHRGTLMAYRRHSATGDPYQSPGDQDLTAHVNFTAVAAAASAQGMEVQPLRTQSQFLMSLGEENQFADAFEDCRLPQERAKVALQLKHLITPSGMGETFHVLIASRGQISSRATR
ncbi:MAG: SAM-dependent methyltransferase [Acidobacteria bacterium]|nr:SAM-dependent methyltransferase [Acidobacteriota bacterium]